MGDPKVACFHNFHKAPRLPRRGLSLNSGKGLKIRRGMSHQLMGSSRKSHHHRGSRLAADSPGQNPGLKPRSFSTSASNADKRDKSTSQTMQLNKTAKRAVLGTQYKTGIYMIFAILYIHYIHLYTCYVVDMCIHTLYQIIIQSVCVHDVGSWPCTRRHV